MRGDYDYAAVAPWMVQGHDSLEPEAPRAVPSWLAPPNSTPFSPLPPYGERPFGERAYEGGSVIPGGRPAPSGAAPHAHVPAHAPGHAPAHVAARAPEPSLAPPPSLQWGHVGALPSLRPLMSLRPTQVPESTEVVALRASLDAALAAATKARQDILEASERDLVALALVVASRVVGRELRTDPTLVAAWVREGVAGLVGEDDVSVSVSPDMADALGQGAGVGYRLTVDPALGPLSCVVRGRYGRVDVGAEARLRLLAEALGAQEAAP